MSQEQPGRSRRELVAALDALQDNSPGLAPLIGAVIADIEHLVDETHRLGSAREAQLHFAWRAGFEASATLSAPEPVAAWIAQRDRLNPYLTPSPAPTPELDSDAPADAELRELIKNATGGYRTTDYTGVIRFQDGTTLCVGSEHDVNWKSEGDQMFVMRVTPYVVSQLLRERDSAEARCERYAKLVRSLGGDPADQTKF